MERKIIIHLAKSPGQSGQAILRENLLPRLHVTFSDEQPLRTDTEILVAGRPTPDQIKASNKLRSLVIPWSGIPTETRHLMKQFPDISVHNLHHNAIPVAELAFSLLLAAAKRIVPLDQSLRKDDWRPRYDPVNGILLDGKTALILGFGAIGRKVAKHCLSLGMKVLATRRGLTSDMHDENVSIYPPGKLHELLPRTDALIICLPHTPETDGLIGSIELSLLPERAILVNVGRGDIVDEEALYGGLQAGRLHGAGLDVWYNYPDDEESRSTTKPSNFPFHELDNVVMSPHRGGLTMDTIRLRMEHLAELLNHAAQGYKLPNLVDLQAGY